MLITVITIHLGFAIGGLVVAKNKGRKKWVWFAICLIFPYCILYLIELRQGENVIKWLLIKGMSAIVLAYFLFSLHSFWIEQYAEIILNQAIAMFEMVGVIVLREGNVIIHESGRLSVNYNDKVFSSGIYVLCYAFICSIFMRRLQPWITLGLMLLSVPLSHLLCLTRFMHRLSYGMAVDGKPDEAYLANISEFYIYVAMTLFIFLSLGIIYTSRLFSKDSMT